MKNGGALSFFAIGGASQIAIEISVQYPQSFKAADVESSQELYGEGDRNQYFGTQMMVTGFNYKKPINEKTFINTTIAYSYESQKSRHDFLARSVNYTDSTFEIDSIYALMGYQFQISKVSAAFSANHKFNKKHLIKFGINADLYLFNMTDSVLDPTHTSFVNRWDYVGNGALIQPYVQCQWRTRLRAIAGHHIQHPFRNARFQCQIRHPERRKRRLFAGLQHY